MKWCEDKEGTNILNEEVRLAYFVHLSKSYKSSSMWAKCGSVAKYNFREKIIIGHGAVIR